LRDEADQSRGLFNHLQLAREGRLA
jgi:hypothetical protein